MFLSPLLRFPLRKKEGFSVLEFLIAMGVLVLVLGGSSVLIFATRDLGNVNFETLKVLSYASEGLEALRAIRDADWTALSPGSYGLSLEERTWVLTSPPEILEEGKFKRQITLTSLGEDRYRVESEISWSTERGEEKSFRLLTYLTNWREPQTGEGPAVVDLGDSANDVYLLGNYLYLAMDNQHETLAILDVSNPEGPSLVTKKDLNGRGEDVFVLGNYAYVPTSTNKVAIVDITNPGRPEQISLMNLSAQPTSIFVKDGYAYIGQDKKNEGLVIYNVANPQTPLFYRSYNIGSAVYDVVVRGSWIYMTVNLGRGLDLQDEYAYVAVDEESGGLEVYYIGWVPWIYHLASVDVGGRGSNVDVEGNRAFVAVKNQDGGVAQLDISFPENPSLKTLVDVGGEGNDVFYKAGYVYTAVENIEGGLAVINVGQ